MYIENGYMIVTKIQPNRHGHTDLLLRVTDIKFKMYKKPNHM